MAFWNTCKIRAAQPETIIIWLVTVLLIATVTLYQGSWVKELSSGRKTTWFSQWKSWNSGTDSSRTSPVHLGRTFRFHMQRVRQKATLLSWVEEELVGCSLCSVLCLCSLLLPLPQGCPRGPLAFGLLALQEPLPLGAKLSRVYSCLRNNQWH